eukprot:CAMPEP_0195074876 /NCGR_PEP_ID=MMETSP0448-20130528/17881_1 /TAXON_ID=66468 /ORGANISM="Heterocapsa triquestra, Strain CCMP 448" /LENGTH=153 /DNA_ID=CAMNT_0040107185 /DNA_START=124 /DNA_END=581 /DNA_ORIENTATION=+
MVPMDFPFFSPSARVNTVSGPGISGSSTGMSLTGRTASPSRSSLPKSLSHTKNRRAQSWSTPEKLKGSSSQLGSLQLFFTEVFISPLASPVAERTVTTTYGSLLPNQSEDMSFSHFTIVPLTAAISPVKRRHTEGPRRDECWSHSGVSQNGYG